MKKVLFIGTSRYDFKRPEKVKHLQAKFEGLSRGAQVFVLARGCPWHKEIWGAGFYLLPNRFLFWLCAFKWAFWLCVFKRIETIVVQSPLTDGLIGVCLKKLLRKELIIEVHGDFLEAPFLYKKRKAGFKRIIIKWLAKRSLKNADKVRAISSFTKQIARQFAPDKPCFVFPTFTDLRLFLDEPVGQLGDYFLFVGALEPVKGLKYLLKAMSEVRPRPMVKLKIAGEGSERQELERLMKELGLSEKVEFKGRLPLEQTKDLMKHCFCLVLPSLSEGLGRVLLEAGALRKPVLASRVGGIVDIVKDGENGFLVEPKNSRKLAEKMLLLLKNKELAVKMGEKGRKFIENNFSNQKYIKNYLEVIYA